MKYIRTKNGIWELESTYEHLGKTYYGIKHRISTFAEEEIIKQADTIEELCDEFLIVRKDDIQTGGDIITFKEMKSQRKCDIEYEVDDEYFYYGGIWTDKGLIYVAKMNDKGVLELL